MKLRYLLVGLSVILTGLLLNFEAPLVTRLLFSKSIVFEIPRKEFRLHAERVWKGDVVRMEVEVQGGDRAVYLLVERVHFYIGPRMERGAPTKVLNTRVYGPSLVTDSDSVTLIIDLEGHLNILFNNTLSSQPKTVTFTRVFERSTNVEYATLIIRNTSALTGGLLLFLGFLENYEELEKKFRNKDS